MGLYNTVYQRVIIFVYFSNKLSPITIIRVQKILPGFSYQKSRDNQFGPTNGSDLTGLRSITGLIGLILL